MGSGGLEDQEPAVIKSVGTFWRAQATGQEGQDSRFCLCLEKSNRPQRTYAEMTGKNSCVWVRSHAHTHMSVHTRESVPTSHVQKP